MEDLSINDPMVNLEIGSRWEDGSIVYSNKTDDTTLSHDLLEVNNIEVELRLIYHYNCQIKVWRLDQAYQRIQKKYISNGINNHNTVNIESRG